MKRYKVNIGEYRGMLFMYSDKDTVTVSINLLPDGTIVTIRDKHPDLPFVTVNEDDGFYFYPLALLTPIKKSDYILRKLK
ncbi:MAG: hypothetical protein JHC33_06130 [Ignisphaera sp.]|jgi:hypothetical protein|nr:hypothetical protein [Ignisphaera sp.]